MLKDFNPWNFFISQKAIKSASPGNGISRFDGIVIRIKFGINSFRLRNGFGSPLNIIDLIVRLIKVIVVIKRAGPFLVMRDGPERIASGENYIAQVVFRRPGKIFFSQCLFKLGFCCGDR